MRMEQGICDVNEDIHGLHVEIEVFESVENWNEFWQEVRGDLRGVGEQKVESLEELKRGVTGVGLEIEVGVKWKKQS